ncbi:MAG: BolA/IbaG family iron-sulfur metabolism protein [Proteobacteria bacterium]|nr:BolA/IbaG family iron-sulfur metabolism protein [Pseudomonadota bacterium]
MIKPDALTAKIRAALPDAEVTLEDLTGTEDHWKARVVSAAFVGQSLMQRHRLVMGALAAELKDRTIHALTLDVKTPDES